MSLVVCFSKIMHEIIVVPFRGVRQTDATSVARFLYSFGQSDLMERASGNVSFTLENECSESYTLCP